jgi:hypothetical protein
MSVRESLGCFSIFLSLSLAVTSCGSGSSDKPASTNLSSTNTAADTTSKSGYTADVTSLPTEINAGQESTLNIKLKGPTGEVIKNLEIVHEKPLHLLIVSKDLSEFYHLHPEPASDGTLQVKQTFPYGGEFRMYLDFKPQGGAQTVLQRDFIVQGSKRPPEQLVADTKLEKEVDTIRVSMKPDAELKAGKASMIGFEVFDKTSGKPALDLENYLGELAHFVVISEDLTDFVHAHPMTQSEHNTSSNENSSHSMNGHPHPEGDAAHDKENSASKTNKVFAHIEFPRPGLYKIWAQFQRQGKVITVPFVVKVEKSSDSTVSLEAPQGSIPIRVDSNGYTPNKVELKKGETARLAFIRESDKGCGDEVLISALGIRQPLPAGKVTVIEVTPDASGSFEFTCGMKMYKGQLNVSE